MSNSSVYREIDVQKQHTMSLRETWTLCVRGVKHRLFRSMLTGSAQSPASYLISYLYAAAALIGGIFFFRAIQDHIAAKL